MTAILALGGYLVVTCVSTRFYRPNPPMLGSIAAVGVLAAVGSMARWTPRVEAAARSFLPAMLLAVAWIGLALFGAHSAVLVRCEGLPPWPLLAGLGAMALALGGRTVAPRRAACWWLPVLVLAWASLAAWVIAAWPAPRIDVWLQQQNACAQLLRGENPYASEHPNVPWDPAHDGEVVRQGDHLRSFAYPPMSLLLALIGYVAGGDVRWAFLVATAGLALVLVATGRRMGLPEGHPAELSAAILLLHPLSLAVVRNAWIEPLLALAAAGSLWAAVAGRGKLMGLAVAATLALKQYGFFWAIPAWSTRRLGWRDLAPGLAAALAVTLPFFLWDPSAFWLGIFRYHLASRYRPDSLSIPAAVQAWCGYRISPALGLVPPVVVAAMVARWARPSAASASLGGASIYLFFFLFGKAGHLNYYWFAGSLLLLACVAAAGEADGAGPAPGCNRGSQEPGPEPLP